MLKYMQWYNYKEYDLKSETVDKYHHYFLSYTHTHTHTHIYKNTVTVHLAVFIQCLLHEISTQSESAHLDCLPSQGTSESSIRWYFHHVYACMQDIEYCKKGYKRAHLIVMKRS